MAIGFTSNSEHTIGVELELHIVDPESGSLINAACDILADLGEGHPGTEHPKAKHELFQSTIEIITGVCSTPAEARDDLAATLAEVREAAARRGLSVIASGTHPFGRSADQLITPNPRYRELVERMQWPARRLLICGTHFHVALSSGEEAIAVFRELQRHLPLFLILSASSPYLEEEDTGLASSRSKVFESLPTAGLPPYLADWRDFESFMYTLLTAGCITSIREVWWDIRPHPDFGTIELRMCDALPTLREIAAVGALAQSLVAWAAEEHRRGTLPPPARDWTIRENRWQAARYGVDAELIVDEHGKRVPAWELLEHLVEKLGPVARRLGCRAELFDLLDLWAIGPSYLRQRRIVDAGGTHRDVVVGLIDELHGDGPAHC